jgi:threonine/homoserine/homoserine lactone efflux protein
MPQIDAIIAVLFAGFVLSATPGPSMLYVLSHTVGQSRAAGLASALGLALGGIILAIATAIGLAALFERFEFLVVVLRYIGSAYLVWLGVGMIRSARENAQVNLTVDTVSQKPFSFIVWQGVLVELLNPKTVLFFALFLPPFVEASGGAGTFADSDVQSQLLILGVLVTLTAIPSDLIVAYLVGSLAQGLNHKQAFRERFAWLGGLTLVAIAANLHLGFI